MAKTLGEHRPDQMVREAGTERFFFTHSTFTFEEVPWNATGSVNLLTVFNREWQKITIYGRFRTACGDQHYRFSVLNPCCTVRLLGDLARLDRQSTTA
jgi:hypothetical protein